MPRRAGAHSSCRTRCFKNRTDRSSVRHLATDDGLLSGDARGTLSRTCTVRTAQRWRRGVFAAAVAFSSRAAAQREDDLEGAEGLGLDEALVAVLVELDGGLAGALDPRAEGGVAEAERACLWMPCRPAKLLLPPVELAAAPNANP